MVRLGAAVDTLLSPEGTTVGWLALVWLCGVCGRVVVRGWSVDLGFFFRARHGLAAYRPRVRGVGVVVGVVGWWCVEMCIVDASIL